MIFDKSIRIAAALSALSPGISTGAHARTTPPETPPALEQREESTATVLRLMNQVMHGWSSDCELPQPKHSMTPHERRIYTQAQRLVYDIIIPFVADFPSAPDVHDALTKGDELSQSTARSRVDAVIPAMEHFLSLRAKYPLVVCPLQGQRRQSR